MTGGRGGGEPHHRVGVGQLPGTSAAPQTKAGGRLIKLFLSVIY